MAVTSNADSARTTAFTRELGSPKLDEAVWIRELNSTLSPLLEPRSDPPRGIRYRSTDNLDSAVCTVETARNPRPTDPLTDPKFRARLRNSAKIGLGGGSIAGLRTFSLVRLTNCAESVNWIGEDERTEPSDLSLRAISESSRVNWHYRRCTSIGTARQPLSLPCDRFLFRSVPGAFP